MATVDPRDISPVLALTANWTNASPTVTANNTNLSNTLSQSGTGYIWHDYWYPYYQPVQSWITTTARPIRLTMSEVERLRVAAKKDKAVREILEKFTDHIEVVVDFA